jgi:hypothetical protein
VLNEITRSYLLKDVLELARIMSSKTLLDLLRLLAFQVGKEVAWRELAAPLGIDGNTVARYLDVLEKSFVLYKLRGYSRKSTSSRIGRAGSTALISSDVRRKHEHRMTGSRPTPRHSSPWLTKTTTRTSSVSLFSSFYYKTRKRCKRPELFIVSSQVCLP